jgi:hypothetical protein
MRTATGNLGEGGGRLTERSEYIAASDNGKFTGTDNPSHFRAINGLLRRPMPREHIDREAGCSNGPELIADLRRRGLSVPCDRVPVVDRDGREVMRGVYHLTATDRRKVREWQAVRGGNHG